MKPKYYLIGFLICFTLVGNIDAHAQIKTLFLVRHAEKANDDTTDPNLSTEGMARAKRLADLLSYANVEFIYSTDYKRTRETGLPLIKATGKAVTLYNPLDASFLEKVINDTGDSRVLIIGHSNTIPGYVNKLIGEERYSQLEENEYDKLFIVTISDENADCVVIKF